MDQFRLTERQRHQPEDVFALAENALKAETIKHKIEELIGVCDLYGNFDQVCNIHREDSLEKRPYSDALDAIYTLFISRLKALLQFFEQPQTPEGGSENPSLGTARLDGPITFIFDIDGHERHLDVARQLVPPSDANSREEMKSLIEKLTNVLIAISVDLAAERRRMGSNVLDREKSRFYLAVEETIEMFRQLS